MRWSVLFVAVGFLGCQKHLDAGLHASNQSLPPQTILLVGQSNMVGAGDGQAGDTDGRVQSFGFDRKIVTATDPLWNVTVTPLIDTEMFRANTDDRYGVGPGRFIAQEILRRYPQTSILLVPDGRGATNLGKDWAISGPLYNDVVARANAVKKLTGRGIDAIMYWQGEGDELNDTEALAWPGRFQNLIASLRQDLGNSSIPVIFVQFKSFAGQNSYRQEIIDGMGGFHYANVAMVSGQDAEQECPTCEHFTYDGYATVGKKMADAYLSMIGGL